MSQPIKKDEIVESGVLDNLIQPLIQVQEELTKTDAMIVSFADVVSGKLNFGEKAKEMREFVQVEQDLIKVYEDKKVIQRESIKNDNEIEKLKRKIAEVTREEAKEVAALKAELQAQNKELRDSAKAAKDGTEAYKALEKEVTKAKNESKNLGAELLLLKKAGQENTAEYQALAQTYADSTAKAAQLDKELKTLDKSVGDNQRNVGNYASAFAELDSRVAEGGMSMREMAKAIKEYQTIAVNAGMTTPIGQEALAKAGELKDRIADVDAVTQALSTDTINLDAAKSTVTGLAGGYQAVQGAMVLVGGENQDMMKAMAKLTAIQSIMNGLKSFEAMINKNNIALLKQTTIGQLALAAATKVAAFATAGATAAAKAFRIALIATGIGAIVVAIGLLIANFDKLVGFVQKGVQWFDKLGTGIKIALSIMLPFVGIIWGVIKALKALGIIESEETKEAEKMAKAKEKALQKQTKARRKMVDEALADNRRMKESINSNYDFEIAKAKAAGKDVYELEKEKRAEMRKTLEAQLLLMEESLKLQSGNAIAMMQIIKDMAAVRSAITQSEQQEEISAIEQIIENRKKAAEQRQEIQRKQEEETAKALERERLLRDYFIASIDNENVQKLTKLQEQHKREREELVKKYGEDAELIKQLETKQMIEVADLRTELREAAYAKESEHNKRIAELEERERKEKIEAEIKALEILNKQREIQNIQETTDKDKFDKWEKQREIQHLEDLLALQEKYGQDTLDTRLALAKARQELDKKEVESLNDSYNTIAKSFEDIYIKAADRAIEAMKRQEEAAANMYSVFAQLAAEGNITAQQSLAEMINRQEELQRRQEQMERRKLRMQRATQASSILVNELDKGSSVPEALAAMGAFLAASESLIPSFYDGTENTGKGGKIDGKGGFAAILHPNERVLTASQNAKIGDIPNPVVADVMYKFRTGQLDSAGTTYDIMALKTELVSIRQAIEKQPQQIVGLEETLSGMVKLATSQVKGNHKTTNRFHS